jgi:hypothetical protein
MSGSAGRAENCPVLLNCPKETSGCIISLFLPSGERRDRFASAGQNIAIFERLGSRAAYCITSGSAPDLNCRRRSFTTQQLACSSGDRTDPNGQVQFFKCKKADYTYLATAAGCREAGGTVGEPQ